MINEYYERIYRGGSKETMPMFSNNEEKKSEVGASEFICYNCGMLGHVFENCPKYCQQTEEYAEFDSFVANDELARTTARSVNSIMELPNQKSDAITEIGSCKNFPIVKLTLCYPNKEIVRIGDVMMDTGACAACIDFNLATQLKAYVLPINTEIRGIVGNFQPAHGAAYALLKHAAIKKPKLIKFQVLKNFDPKMLLGNSFIELFFAGMVNHGGTYQVKLRDKSDGDWLTPELSMRFCTAEESCKLFRIHDLPTFEAIAARQAFFDALQLFYPRFEEAFPGPEMKSGFQDAEFQKTNSR